MKNRFGSKLLYCYRKCLVMHVKISGPGVVGAQYDHKRVGAKRGGHTFTVVKVHGNMEGEQ